MKTNLDQWTWERIIWFCKGIVRFGKWDSAWSSLLLWLFQTSRRRSKLWCFHSVSHAAIHPWIHTLTYNHSRLSVMAMFSILILVILKCHWHAWKPCVRSSVITISNMVRPFNLRIMNTIWYKEGNAWWLLSNFVVIDVIIIMSHSISYMHIQLYKVRSLEIEAWPSLT